MAYDCPVLRTEDPKRDAMLDLEEIGCDHEEFQSVIHSSDEHYPHCGMLFTSISVGGVFEGHLVGFPVVLGVKMPWGFIGDLMSNH